MNMHAHMLAHTCVHACIVKHMDLYIIVTAYSHTPKYTVHLHIPDGNTCMLHTINLSGNDGTLTDKQCDMHMYMHPIPFINCCCACLYRPLQTLCVLLHLSSVQVFLLITPLCSCSVPVYM